MHLSSMSLSLMTKVLNTYVNKIRFVVFYKLANNSKPVFFLPLWGVVCRCNHVEKITALYLHTIIYLTCIYIHVRDGITFARVTVTSIRRLLGEYNGFPGHLWE